MAAQRTMTTEQLAALVYAADRNPAQPFLGVGEALILHSILSQLGITGVAAVRARLAFEKRDPAAELARERRLQDAMTQTRQAMGLPADTLFIVPEGSDTPIPLGDL